MVNSGAAAEITADGATPAQFEELRDWIRQTRAPGIRVDSRRASGREGDMGTGLVEALVVTIPTLTALTQLVTAIHGWIGASRGRAPGEVTIEADGVKITVKGTAPLPELLAEARAALAAVR